MGFKQKDRLAVIETPVGADAFLVVRLEGEEGVSRPYRYELDLLAEKENLNFNDLVGQRALLRLALPDGAERYVHGVVSRFAQAGSEGGLWAYRLELVPWLWLLTRRADCRIFQNLAVPDIVKRVFDELKLMDYELRLDGAYEPWVYCVQYRETDFAFVSRLLEEEGIHYYFEQTAKGYKLILADNSPQNPVCPEVSKFKYDAAASGNLPQDVINRWQVEQTLQPGRYALSDFNFLDPSTSLLVGLGSAVKTGADDKLEVFDYPGAYVKLGDETSGKLDKGEARLKLRQQEGDAQARVITGGGGCRTLTAGHRFVLSEHFHPDFAGQGFLLTAVRHHLRQGPPSSQGAPVEARYENEFICTPQSVPYRPPRATPRPRVAGPQTAIVVGPEGEEIYTDMHGRVKVQFHWDRRGKYDEESSCWVRVAQGLAGKEWGLVFHPRIGQEVVVDFLEGDPDQPLITGRVYNAEQPIPYAPNTQSGIKTRSTKEGGPANYNEIRFEDEKGKEELHIHAEKDESIVVENNKTEQVGANETITIGKNRVETVGDNETLTVGGNRTRVVSKNESVSVAISRTHAVGANEAITVGGAQEVVVGGARTVTVGGQQTVSIGGAQNINVGGDQAQGVGKNLTETVGEDQQVKVGKKLVYDAGDEITIKTGKAELVMKKSGAITLKGDDITIEGKGKISVKASKDIVLKGQKITEN